MDEALLDRLRRDLEAADYRELPVRTLLGAENEAARLRGVLSPSRRRLEHVEESALAILVRIFLLGEEVSAAEVRFALPSLGIEGAETLGLLTAGTDRHRAQLSLNPVDLPDSAAASPDTNVHWWILSDLDDQLRNGPARPDHVMGVGGATRSLLAQLPPLEDLSGPGFRALDLGTGCGVIALSLAQSGAPHVIATDISERALTLARANARLNGMDDRIEFRQGDLFSPVAGEEFDLIASNPPFVITPRTSQDDAPRYDYRDAGMIGDALAARVVQEAPAHLTEGGTLICLANWESPWGRNGLDRVREWVERAVEHSGPLAAWVIERDRIDPVRYAETWVRDGGARPGEPEFDRLMRAWLQDFAERRIVAIGLGSIRLQRVDGGRALGAQQSAPLRTEHVPDPFGPDHPGAGLATILGHGVRVSEMTDSQVLGQRWVRSEWVTEVREHRPGEESPRALQLRIDRPIARAVQADPLLAAAVGACDGELSLAQIADALATILEVDPGDCANALIEGVRELVWLGMLAPTTR